MEIQELDAVPPRGRSFILGVVGSVIGALIGAVVWCVIAVLTQYELGIIAWALGGLAGFGMALAYRKGTAAAGGVAAVIAILGILAARIMIVGYMSRGELAEIRSQLAMMDLPTEQLENVLRLAVRDAAQTTEDEGRCFFDDRYWQQIYEAGAKYASLPEDELAAAIADYREWDRTGCFEDTEHIRRTLPYHLLGETLLEIRASQEPVPEEEWRPAFEAASRQAAALDPGEQSRTYRRRVCAAAVAHMNSGLRGAETGLAPADDKSSLRLLKEAYTEALAMDDAALTDAYALANAMEWEEGEWNSPKYQRLRLTYDCAERAWREREGASDEENPPPGPAWDECHRQAAETVAAMSDEEVAERAQASEKEADEESLARRQELKSEWHTNIARGTVMYALSSFGLIDVLFLGLAVVTAYRIGKSGI